MRAEREILPELSRRLIWQMAGKKDIFYYLHCYTWEIFQSLNSALNFCSNIQILLCLTVISLLLRSYLSLSPSVNERYRVPSLVAGMVPISPSRYPSNTLFLLIPGDRSF